MAKASAPYFVPTNNKPPKKARGDPAPKDKNTKTVESVFGSSFEDRVYIGLLRLGWKADQIDAQQEKFGGRAWRGGQVVDFVVYTPLPIAILCQGNYWHDDPDREFNRIAALTEEYTRVVEVWDYECPNEQQLMATLRAKVGTP